MLATIRRNPRKSAMAALGLIIALGGAIKVTPDIYNAIEPIWYASRAYARDLQSVTIKEAQSIGERNNVILRDLQIEQAEGKRDAAANDIAKWNVELAKAEKQNDAALAYKIRDAISKLTSIHDRLDAQIKTLNKLRGVHD